jgi:L-alanine-DL-glutamate epimerase-like enolase superfamily enzyme
MSPTSICALEIVPLNIPLLEPFGISGGCQVVASNVLVKIELQGGAVGLGEAAPLPPYNGETQADAMQALRSARGWLMGRDAADWRQLGAEFRQRAAPGSGSAQCALETALLDACQRYEGRSLVQFFGGAGTTLETDMTITTGTPAAAAAAARKIQQRGIRVIKVKIGGPSGPEHDVARIAAIHEVAPDSPLILDGNAGISREDAQVLVVGLKRNGITPELLEQWLPKADLAGMKALHEESGWTVAADEAVSTRAEAELVVATRAAQVINIKLMKAGIATAMEIVDVAKAAGLGLMIGGNVESILAMSTSAALAAGTGGFRYADLDTPWFLAENPFVGGFVANGGSLSLAHIVSGHGVGEVSSLV